MWHISGYFSKLKKMRYFQMEFCGISTWNSVVNHMWQNPFIIFDHKYIFNINIFFNIYLIVFLWD